MKMGKFALPAWDSNDVGDEICNSLFKKKGKSKAKAKDKVKNKGKILKAKFKKAKVDINEKLVKNVGNNVKNIKNTVNQKKNEIVKNIKKAGFNKETKNEDINTSQKGLIKQKKKIKKSQNLPNFKHLKTMIETKLQSEEDQKNLFSEDGNQTILDTSSSSTVRTNSKKKMKKRDLKHLKKDISKKIDTELFKSQKKFKQKKGADSKEICNLNTTVDSNSGDESSLVKKNSKKAFKNLSLRERMMAKLKASRFRYLNEQLYCSPSKDAQNLFNSDPDSYKAYHEGFRQQVSKWPVNPVDVIIRSLKKMNKNYVIADFGCGDAKIAQEVSQKVHSFDLVATNERVTACDMAKVPLNKESVDVAVFCLSLMGTNLQDYLKEANRVLKMGGILKIAEVESRFENVDEFIKGVQHFGFQNTYKDLTHNIFYFLDFKKISNVKKTKGLPTLSLNPCLYKKR